MKTVIDKIAESNVSVDVYDISYVLFRTDKRSRTYYSVKAEITNTVSGERDERTVRDITGDECEALEMFRLIVDGAVTPMTLEDVICDMIS